MTLVSLRRRRSSRRRNRGQTLVEFALVFPIFIVLLLGLIEFAFVFNAMLATNFAARDAALAAAEVGDGSGGDCAILDAVEKALGPPADEGRIQSIEIFRAQPNGAMIGTPTTYVRAAPRSCTFPDGTVATVPYTSAPNPNGYPSVVRCNILNGEGCPDPGPNRTVDNVAVRITYHHNWVTPLRTFVGGNPGGLTFDRSSVMRMEPIL